MKIILNIISFILLFGLSPLVHADVVPPPKPIKLYGLEQTPVKCKDIEGWRCIGEYYVDDNYNKREPVNSFQVEGKFDLGSAVEEDKLIVLEKDGYYKETEIDSFNEWVKSKSEKLNLQGEKKRIIYHNAEGHFSFVLPDGWVEFSKGQLSATANSMSLLGNKVEFLTGYYDKEKTSRYALIRIKENGWWSENKLQKMISDGTIKKAIQDKEKIFKDLGTRVAVNNILYDNKQHILYMKTEIGSGVSKTIAVSAAILSGYGLVQVVTYSSESDVGSSSRYLEQIIDSFNFDKGYGYLDGQKKSESSFSILPKSVAACILLFMTIHLSQYWKLRWLKFIGLIFLCAIIGRLIPYLQHLLPDVADGLDIILAIFIGVFWYKQYRKIKKE
jgi:hypothetical protein